MTAEQAEDMAFYMEVNQLRQQGGDPGGSALLQGIAGEIRRVAKENGQSYWETLCDIVEVARFIATY